MSEAAHVKPCVSCPYRCDVPSGIWHPDEYAKLPPYDRNEAFEKFMCHSERSKLCRGWLSVHCESVAVRLCMSKGDVTPEEVFAKPLVKLFNTGLAAAVHGMKQVNRPGKKAREMIASLTKKLTSAPAAPK